MLPARSGSARAPRLCNDSDVTGFCTVMSPSCNVVARASNARTWPLTPAPEIVSSCAPYLTLRSFASTNGSVSVSEPRLPVSMWNTPSMPSTLPLACALVPGTGSAAARPFRVLEFRGVVNGGARMLVVELHRKALEELITDDTRDVGSPSTRRMNASRSKWRTPGARRRCRRFPCGPRASRRRPACRRRRCSAAAFRPGAYLREHLREQHISPARIEEHAEGPLRVQHDLDEKMPAVDLERHFDERAAGEREIRLRRRRLHELHTGRRLIELHRVNDDELVVPGVAARGRTRNGILTPARSRTSMYVSVRVSWASRSTRRSMSLVSVLIHNSNGRPPSGTILMTSNSAPSAVVRSLYEMRAGARSGYQNASRSR